MQVHLLNVLEVAQFLHISRSYAYLLISRGDIASLRLGHALRVHPADLETYLATRRLHVEMTASVRLSGSTKRLRSRSARSPS